MEPTPDLEKRGKGARQGASRHHAAVSLVRVPEAVAKTFQDGGKPEKSVLMGKRKLVNPVQLSC
jgi:hypothetical protein